MVSVLPQEIFEAKLVGMVWAEFVTTGFFVFVFLLSHQILTAYRAWGEHQIEVCVCYAARVYEISGLCTGGFSWLQYYDNINFIYLH